MNWEKMIKKIGLLWIFQVYLISDGMWCNQILLKSTHSSGYIFKKIIINEIKMINWWSTTSNLKQED